MTTGAGNRLFVDTNVLVYANIIEAPLHKKAVRAIAAHRRAGAELWLSYQILREFLATVTRPQSYAGPPPLDTMIKRVQRFQRIFRVVNDGPGVTARLLALIQQVPVGGKQIHDANIVATMLEYGITYLLTHNTGDFTRYGAWITVVPLESGIPAEQ